MRISSSRWFTAAVLAGVVSTVAIAGAQKPGSAEVALEAAAKTEMVDGDLRGAIARYRTIIATYAADHAVAARALVRMAQCYEKLGDQEVAEARKAYERILRDYPDQKEAVSVARARLGSKESALQSGATSSRKVWTLTGGAVVYGTVSHDGRYLPYSDFSVPGGNGELFLHDTATGTDRRITHEVEQFASEFAWDVTFSPDDTQLAYAWSNGKHHELRIIGVQVAGVSRPRVLFSNPEVPRIAPGNWSLDGQWLAVRLTRRDKTEQIALVAVKDGSLRVLKSQPRSDTSKLFFSPDSKYLAYDLPTGDSGTRRDVFVLALDGSREIPAVVHPADDGLMGWSPDGRQLLFTSDRTGSRGLWALAVVDGKPQGAPEQIKADIAGGSMGLTSGGALYSLVHHSNFTGVIRSDIQVAAFDFEKGQFLSKPTLAVEAFVGANNFPAWSPDGKSLAFLSGRAGGRSGYVIMILSPDTGQLRELHPPVSISIMAAWSQLMRWSPDGLSLAVPATDVQGRQGLFRIDATTGEASPIVFGSPGPTGGGTPTPSRALNPVWAPDGKKIYYLRFDPGDGFTVVIERELSSGSEKEVIRRSRRAIPMDVALSPDGRYWAALDGDWFAGSPAEPGVTRKWSVLLIPASGGEPKELMRGESHGAGVLMWAPDSRSCYVYSIKSKSTGAREVWRVGIDGTEPQRLGLDVGFLGNPATSDQRLHPHPDGKRVAFAAAEPAKPDEVWVLENFLPTLNKRK